MIDFIIYCILAVSSVAAVLIMKKIQPDKVGPYVAYIIVIMAVAALYFKPWSVFC